MKRPANRPVQSIALVLAATLSFALGDVATKYLAQHHPVPVILMVRYGVNAVLIGVFLYPSFGRDIWIMNNRVLVIAWSLCLALASVTLALALRLMPVGETIAIVYLCPFLVMLLSARFLAEPVPPGVWVWAIAGFAGVLLVLRPGGGLDPIGAFYAVINAGLATAYHLLTRLASRTETTVALQFHAAWVGGVVLILWSLPLLAGLEPDRTDLILMIGLGLAYSVGHYLFTAAYRLAPASLLAPINYSHLVWAGGLGFLFFGDFPDGISLFGMTLVGVSGVAIALAARSRSSNDRADQPTGR
ncbi:DMT family transporter [Tropicimonas marinistellae]|uniref:DMT family transporter n=1 Tax=Tropicimonas marinistellae TaxID=1739787 RepID=UPI000832B188|nr:DMT family transporter [Tropicimonas marinistellae]